MKKTKNRIISTEVKISAILNNWDDFEYTIFNDGFEYGDVPLCDVSIRSLDEHGEPTQNSYGGILCIKDLESIIQASEKMIIELKRKKALKPKTKKRVKK